MRLELVSRSVTVSFVSYVNWSFSSVGSLTVENGQNKMKSVANVHRYDVMVSWYSACVSKFVEHNTCIVGWQKSYFLFSSCKVSRMS